MGWATVSVKRSISPNSLAGRLVLAAAGWAFLLVSIGAFGLSNLYRLSVERSFDDRLAVYLSALVASATGGGENEIAPSLGIVDPRFDDLFSGWYWQVQELGVPSGQSLASHSLSFERISVPPSADSTPGAIANVEFDGPQGEPLRGLTRTIEFEKSGKRYQVLVAGDTQEIETDIAAFRRVVIWSLLIFSLCLIATTVFQVRFGLRPLRDIGLQLASIRAGRATRLDGNFPTEIRPLAVELNALIESNQAVVERARTHVGNLAHALKTPLSVISNEAASGKGALADKVGEQAGIMRGQIDHYLRRARMAARANVIGVVTPVEPALAALARAMRKIYERQKLEITLDCPRNVKFAGERQDFDEISGNLVDNACKWAKNRVAISLEPVAGDRPRLRFIVDDDGPGLSEQERNEVMRRGARLDETKPGSGLGLSIVSELAALYSASFALQDSPLGGLRAELLLPAADEH